MIIRKIRLTEYEYQPPINFVAGATEPDIQFQLADYTIPAGATARCYVQRFDGTFEYTVASIEGNNVTVEPTSSMFSVRGEGAIQVTLYADEEVLKTFSVPVFVHADLADENAEQGSDVTGIFRAAEEQALEDFQEQAEEKAAEVIESIPADYTELTEEVGELNERLGAMDTATSEDVGKTLKVKTVENGKVAEWEFGEAGGRSGTGLTEDMKQALLACFEQVVWTGNDGQDYIDALETALYPPANLASISAVYTQPGTVYDTDSLDSLKSDLVVTAHYDDGTDTVVTTYTLSGTLAEGTSTVAVLYGGKSTTFTVTVTHYDNSIYNWDFTESLIDSKQEATAILSGSSIYRDSSGIHITTSAQAIDLGEILARDRTYEIDIADCNMKVSGQHVRFLMAGTSADTGTGMLLWNKNSAWRAYWSNTWSSNSYSTTHTVFNGSHTIKMQINAGGKVTILLDGVEMATDSHTFSFASDTHLYIGNTGSAVSGGNLYNVIITGVRVYEGVV